jgi:hypothetical protein
MKQNDNKQLDDVTKSIFFLFLFLFLDVHREAMIGRDVILGTVEASVWTFLYVEKY